MKLDSSFYRREDVVQLSRELLGKVLCTDLPGGFCQVNCPKLIEPANEHLPAPQIPTGNHQQLLAMTSDSSIQSTIDDPLIG